jgi:predicted DNA-binding transcriptional regulator YafY
MISRYCVLRIFPVYPKNAHPLQLPMPRKKQKNNALDSSSNAQPDGSHLSPALAAPERTLHGGRLTRIEYIHDRLCEVRAGRLKISAKSLARELSRSRNTILEDLQAMREQFRAPVTYDPHLGTLRYIEDPTAPYELRPRVHLDGIRTLALVASACLSSTRAFPLGGWVRDALTQIAPVVDGTVSLDPEAVEGVISAPDNPASENDGRHFIALYDAIRCRREVRMIYQKPSPAASSKPRLIHPLHLAIVAEGCILIAHDTGSGKVQNFALERIHKLDLTGAGFEPPKEFDLKKYLAGRIGRFIGEPRFEVRVRFTAERVPYVRTNPWQPGQVLVDLPGGRAEATYRVPHTREIEQRVLAACGGAEVVSPHDVRDRIHAAAAAIAASHAAT